MGEINNIEELTLRQRAEREEFVEQCSHTDVKIIDETVGFRRREIALICQRCQLNLLGYTIDGNWSYLSYVRDCVNGHPHNRKEKQKYYAIYGKFVKEIIGITADEDTVEKERKDGSTLIEITKQAFDSFGDDPSKGQWQTLEQLYTLKKKCRHCGYEKSIKALQILPDFKGAYSSEIDFCPECDNSW